MSSFPSRSLFSSSKIFGSTYLGKGTTHFQVWAPKFKRIKVQLLHPKSLEFSLNFLGHGMFAATLKNIYPGALYYLRGDSGKLLPDPASQFRFPGN